MGTGLRETSDISAPRVMPLGRTARLLGAGAQRLPRLLYQRFNPLFADPGRWDRYPYGSGFRDPRPYDRRYWYDAEYEPYRKDSYAYADRWVRRPSPRGMGISCGWGSREPLASQPLSERGGQTGPPALLTVGAAPAPGPPCPCLLGGCDLAAAPLNLHPGLTLPLGSRHPLGSGLVPCPARQAPS